MIELISGNANQFHRDIDLPPYPDFEPGYFPESVHVHFHLTPHRSAEHLDEALPRLAQTDILAAENIGWNEKHFKEVRSITRGDTKLLARLTDALDGNDNKEFVSTLMGALFGTYKPVIYVDADATQTHLMVGNFGKKYLDGLTEDVETSLHGLADALADIAQAAHGRDLIMAETLGPAVTQKVAEHPKLRNKNAVQVMYLLGFNHRQVYTAMSQHPATTAQVSESTWAGLYDLDPENILVKRYKEGGAATKQELGCLMAALALNMVRMVPWGRRPVYDFAGAYTRTPNEYDLAGPIALDAVLSMGDDGLSLAHRFLRRRSTKEDKDLIAEVANEAKAQVS